MTDKTINTQNTSDSNTASLNSKELKVVKKIRDVAISIAIY